MKKRKKKIIIFGIILFILILSSFLLFRDLGKSNYYELESRVEQVKETKVLNAETLGWIKVQGTNIDIPIIDVTTQVENDSTQNYAWYSNIYNEGENRKAIYGHNIRNVSKKPLIADPGHYRFEQLMSFTDYDFAKENLYIQLTENGEDKLYQIYAAGFYSQGVEVGESFAKDKLDEYIESARNNSIYDYDVEVDEDDEIIALVTCTRYFGLYEKTQFRIDAKKIEKNKKNLQYSVATNTNYDIMKEE